MATHKREHCHETYHIKPYYTYFLCITGVFCHVSTHLLYPKKLMRTPAATAEPMTPDMLLDMQ